MNHRLARRATPAITALLAFAGVLIPASGAQASSRWVTGRSLFNAPVSGVEFDPFHDRPGLDVATDGAGNSVAAWIAQTGSTCRAMWAARPVGGSWTAPRPLGATMSGCPSGQVQLDMNPSGTAVVAWAQVGATRDVYVALRRPGGVFGTGRRLNTSGSAYDPSVSINAGGTAAVAWDDNSAGPYLLRVAVRRPGGSFGRVESVTDTAAPSVFVPRVVVGPAGDVVAAWVNNWSDGRANHVAVETAYRPANGTFGGAPVVLRDFTGYSSHPWVYAPDLDVDARGRVSAVWVAYTGPARVVQSAQKPAGAASFGAPRTVNPADAGDASFARVAVDPATGAAVASWLQCASTCAVRTAARAAGAAFGQLRTLSGGQPLSIAAPSVAAAPNGAVAVAWAGRVNGAAPLRIQVAVRPRGGRFGAPAVLPGTANDTGPTLSVDARGNAVALWLHTGASGTVVRGADYYAAWYRPDQLLRRHGSGYVGAKVYGASGANQRVSAGVRRGRSVTFDVTIVNRSSVADTFVVKGTGGRRGFAVRYLAGGRTVTSAVVHGRYRLAGIAPGSSRSLRLVVTVRSYAALRTVGSWLVTASSAHDSVRRDATTARVRVVR